MNEQGPAGVRWTQVGRASWNLLHFEDFPEALEYRQSVAQRTKG